MAIPYNVKLSWGTYSNPDNRSWYENLADAENEVTSSFDGECEVDRAMCELLLETPSQTCLRTAQFVRDTARLILKVPIRLVKTPINWKQIEGAKINAKLTGYSFMQLLSVPAKFLVALTALTTLTVSFEKGKWLLDKSDECTAYLDGRASQLEALKEEGRNNAQSSKEYKEYRDWLYTIDPKLCRKIKD